MKAVAWNLKASLKYIANIYVDVYIILLALILYEILDDQEINNFHSWTWSQNEYIPMDA